MTSLSAMRVRRVSYLAGAPTVTVTGTLVVMARSLAEATS